MIMIGLVLLATGLKAQENATPAFPQVGKPCPEFIFNHVTHFKTTHATNKDFLGKWLVLDFWDTGCHSCIHSFPFVNRRSKEFAGQLQYLMVDMFSKDEKLGDVEAFYDKYRQRENLVMPCAFDSVLSRGAWTIYSAPTEVVVDPEGIVRGVTHDLVDNDLKNFIAGKMQELTPAFIGTDTIDHRPVFEGIQAIQTGDDQTLVHSVVSKFDEARVRLSDNYNPPDNLDSCGIKGQIQIIDRTSSEIFYYAWCGVEDPGVYSDNKNFGKISRFPILLLRDTSQFTVSEHSVYNHYAFELVAPPGKYSSIEMRSMMQAELECAFNCTARVEERELPCWLLKLRPGFKAKLVGNNGEVVVIEHSDARWIIKNDSFGQSFWPGYVGRGELFDNRPIFNETGFKMQDNINLTISNRLVLNMEEAKKTLWDAGFELVPAKRKMKVLVIRDAQQANVKKSI